jgi:hypothetical protein
MNLSLFNHDAISKLHSHIGDIKKDAHDMGH